MNASPVMETVSEKTKGRPRGYARLNYERLTSALWHDPDACERSRLNHAYIGPALRALCQGDEDMETTFDRYPYLLRRPGGKFAVTVIVALGRLYDETGDAQGVQGMADDICSGRLRARDAVAWINRTRALCRAEVEPKDGDDTDASAANIRGGETA